MELSQSSKNLSLTIGCYTPDSPYGLYHLDLNTKTGQLNAEKLDIQIPNPSYFDINQSQMYVISEVTSANQPKISQYSFQHSLLTKVANLDITGCSPCFVSVNSKYQLATTAQYGSGHIDVYQLDDALVLKQHIQVIDSSTIEESPRVSHAHQALILNHTKTLVSVDLGLDQVSFYPFDQATHLFSIEERQELSLSQGSGPRHLVFTHDEKIGIALCELSEQLVLIHQEHGKWRVSSEQPAFPNTLNGQAAGAIKLSPDERFVYLSGRRQNIISCFELDHQSKVLNYQYSIDCGGNFPRDFAISPSGEWLVVVNQNSHNIVSFKRNNADGTLEKTGHSTMVTIPVCIKFGDWI